MTEQFVLASPAPNSGGDLSPLPPVIYARGVHERYRRQTDVRTTTNSEHEHEFTFAKNRYIFLPLFGLIPRRRVTDGQGTKWRRNIADNFNRLSARTLQTTDRRQTTDRQTDGRTTTDSEHEHEFTFAKNGTQKQKFPIWKIPISLLTA